MTEENKQESPPPSWFIDEGIAGIGERPSWLPEKYKTVADLAKSNAELEKRFGQAPDEYDFNKSRYLDPDYEPLQDLKKFGKEKRVSQEVFDKVFETIDKYMDEFSTDYKDEIKKLGDNAENRVTTLDNWAKANLSKESYEALSQGLRTADQIKALEELRGKVMSNTTQIPTGNSGAISNPATVQDVQKEIAQNLEKYKTDEKYRSDVSRRLEAAVKTSPEYIDKVGA